MTPQTARRRDVIIEVLEELKLKYEIVPNCSYNKFTKVRIENNTTAIVFYIENLEWSCVIWPSNGNTFEGLRENWNKFEVVLSAAELCKQKILEMECANT